jgi:hypothetical protein
MEIRKKLYHVKTRVLDLLCDLSAGARNFEVGENIIIFSYPRSGSTWLTELIRGIPGTVILWEPLHIRSVEPFAKLGFGWRQHIPEDEEWKEAEEVFAKLYRGEYLNFWLTSREFPLNFVTADRMIVKFVRANALALWLLNRFNFDLTPIYLLRHPFAIAASQMKEGSWDYEFDGYEIPDMPYNEIIKQHSDFLFTINSKPEKMVATWCINNRVMLDNEHHNHDWLTVYYEALLLHPEEELQRIFDQWNMEMPNGILDRIRKESSTTKEATFKKDLELQLSKWRIFFSSGDIKRMQRVLDYFEINIYSSEALLPEFMREQEQQLFD